MAVATVVPFYFSYSQADIVRFFTKLVEISSLPVFIYNNPKTTGVTIDIDTLKSFRQLDYTVSRLVFRSVILLCCETQHGYRQVLLHNRNRSLHSAGSSARSQSGYLWSRERTTRTGSRTLQRKTYRQQTTPERWNFR